MTASAKIMYAVLMEKQQKSVEMRWIDEKDMVISEVFGSEKPALANYEYFMKHYPECHDFTYVGDNPRKDFIAPNALGWQTVCLKDDGRNIHRQEVDGIEEGMMPKRWIERLKNLTTMKFWII